MAISQQNPLYHFLNKMDFTALPEEVVSQAKLCLIDLLGTLAAGSRTQLSYIIEEFAQHQFAAGPGCPEAFTLRSGTKLSPSGAAMVDGMTIDSMDAHDGHSMTKGHVGCAVLPAIVATIGSDTKDLSGQALLTYLVAGYEIGTRSGMILHHTADDYHSSGAWNAVTCAALVAHRLQLTEEQFDHAVGIAEYHGPRSQLMRDVDHPTMVKDGSGWGAMAGVSAAYMAQLGFTGAPALTVLEVGVQAFWSDLGAKWRILEQYFKPYPVCRWAHPAIDAVLLLKKSNEFTVDEVESVTVHTFHEAARLSQVPPQTSDQAQYATCFPIAVALCRGDVLPEHVIEGKLADADILDMFDKISILEDDEFSQRFPQERLAKVKIRCYDGRVFLSEPTIAKGDPKNPLSRQNLEAKFFALATPVWGHEKSQDILSLANSLDQPGVCASDLLNLIRTKNVVAN
jgi:2-methylcitrate dehydratase PrpD